MKAKGALLLLLVACFLTTSAPIQGRSLEKIEVYNIGDIGANVIYNGGKEVFLDDRYANENVQEKEYEGVNFDVLGVILDQNSTEIAWMEADKSIDVVSLRDAEAWARSKGARNPENATVVVSDVEGSLVWENDIYVAVFPIGKVGKMRISHHGQWNETKDVLEKINLTIMRKATLSSNLFFKRGCLIF